MSGTIVLGRRYGGLHGYTNGRIGWTDDNDDDVKAHLPVLEHGDKCNTCHYCHYRRNDIQTYTHTQISTAVYIFMSI